MSIQDRAQHQISQLDKEVCTPVSSELPANPHIVALFTMSIYACACAAELFTC